jgi:hypothetical protein
MLVYIVLHFRDKASTLRTILAVLIIICIPLAWLSLSDLSAAIRVGHVFWIGGLLLVLLPASEAWPTLEDARWLAVLPLLLVTWWSLKPATVSPLHAPTDRDIFIYEVALQFKDPELCQRIPRYVEGNGSGGDPGREISYLRSDCYFNLAGTLNQKSLCDKVRPISKGFRDGSKYSPQWCRVNRLYQAVSIVNPHTITAWMRQLGYTDPEIYRFEYRNVFNNPIHEAYDQLRKDGLFAQRIAAAPYFDKSTEATKSRPANDLEYLYGMFAVDANDPTVCGKISPNATSRSPSQQTVPLRLDCYRSLAFNDRDARLCEKLPARSNLDSGARDYDSRETCFRDVEIERRDPQSKLTTGPGFPPSYESFRDALRAIGYDVELPRPTYSEYEDFLQNLERNNPAGRVEFLRRVAALN